jgi:hypothetical protein
MDLDALRTLWHLFPSGQAQMWGVRPGAPPKRPERDPFTVNEKRFAKLTQGDLVVFAGDSRIYFSATVAHKWRDPGLATELWGVSDGQTWELMYALIGGTPLDVPMSEFRAAIPGWENENRHVRGFQVLEEEESRAIRDYLGLKATEVPDVTGPDEAETEPASWFEGELDRVMKRIARGEQPVLRRKLIPGDTGVCALCGRKFPSEFLVAAHIKKRAYCSDEEKSDLANIAMIACSFGCDDLYERGYITVAAGGRIDVSFQADAAPVVADYVRDHLAGRTTEAWTPERDAYFDWHRKNTFRADVRIR